MQNENDAADRIEFENEIDSRGNNLFISHKKGIRVDRKINSNYEDDTSISKEEEDGIRIFEYIYLFYIII